MRILRQILSIPLRIALPVTTALPLVNRRKVLRALWRLDPTSLYGPALVAETLTREGGARAAALGAQMFEQAPAADLARLMSAVAAQRGRIQEAYDWYRRILDLQPREEDVIFLRILLGDYFPELDAAGAIEEMLARRDVAMEYTLAALMVKLEFTIRRRDWETAEGLFARIDRIQEVPALAWIPWVLALARQDERAAERALARAGAHAKQPGVFAMQQALGWYCLGDLERAREYTRTALEAGLEPYRFYLAYPEMAEAFFAPEQMAPPLDDSA